jgi:hypothetical protein
MMQREAMSLPRDSAPLTAILEWLRLAGSTPIRRRALRYTLVVGAVLITINHGDAILRGDLPFGRLLRIGLTILVPYLVSTFSSVGTILQLRRE